MTRKRSKLLFLLALLLLLVGLPAWWLYKEIQHERYNAALIVAIKADDTQTVLQALNHGADPNARDTGDTTASMGECLRHLWNRLRGWKEVNFSALPALVLVLEYEDEPDGSYLPPARKRMLKALLASGANPNFTLSSSMTPLLIAAGHGDLEDVSLLLAHGADINARDRKERSVLYQALLNKPSIAYMLAKRGVDIHTRDCGGETPLFWAVRAEKSDFVKFLVDRGVDVNVANEEKRTALTYAIESSDVDTVRLLLRKGADVKIKDVSGKTAMGYAKQSGNAEIIRLLKQYGAK